jgi:hypothetical protein
MATPGGAMSPLGLELEPFGALVARVE